LAFSTENPVFGTDSDYRNPHITRHYSLGNSKKTFLLPAALSNLTRPRLSRQVVTLCMANEPCSLAHSPAMITSAAKAA